MTSPDAWAAIPRLTPLEAYHKLVKLVDPEYVWLTDDEKSTIRSIVESIR